MARVRKKMIQNVTIKRRLREEEESSRPKFRTLLDAEAAEIERQKIAAKRWFSKNTKFSSLLTSEKNKEKIFEKIFEKIIGRNI
jgi:hypothetical protein